MIDERRTARAADMSDGPSHVLPAKAWREIVQRASTLGMVAELLAGGTEVRLVATWSWPTSRQASPAAA